MDAGHRSCTVCATNGPNIVSLVINFPAHYPNQAIPSFEFTSDTTIDTNTKTKLMKVRVEFLSVIFEVEAAVYLVPKLTFERGSLFY